jgi:hypothetical protein
MVYIFYDSLIPFSLPVTLSYTVGLKSELMALCPERKTDPGQKYIETINSVASNPAHYDSAEERPHNITNKRQE